MKVEIPAKRGASRDKKRGDNRSKMQTDITVTVKNEKDSSIEKAPVAAPIGHSSRTIVRLNTKTESTGLEKVTVKSLDEIKRDKERRLQQGSAASQNSTTSKSLSGVTDPGKEWNGKSQPRQTPSSPLVRPQKTDTTAVATCADSTSSSFDNPSLVSTKIALKELTIPLSALSPRSSTKSKASQDLCKSRSATSSRPTESVNSSLDSSLSSQDFCSLGDDEHDVDEDLDEEFLLQDNEGSRQSGCREQGTGFGDYSGVPLGLRYSKEEEDETISIYADDSMFEEEDEYYVSNDRLYPRSFGRKSTDDSKKDLRTLLTDRQQNRQSEGHPSNLLEKDCHLKEDEKVEALRPVGKKAGGRDKSLHDQNVTENKKEPPSSRSNYFGQTSGRPLSKQNLEDRWNCRGSSKQGSRWSGRRQLNSGFLGREGHGPRRSQEKSHHDRGLIHPPRGDGILPLPDPRNRMFLTPTLHNIEALKAVLEVGIQDNLKKTVEILTNPPPVPGEMVDFIKPESLPLRKCGFKSSGKRSDERRTARHSPTKSHHSNMSGNNGPPAGSTFTKQDRWKNTNNFSRDRVQLNSQKLGRKEVVIPEWLKRSYQGKCVEQEINVGKDTDKHPQPDNVDPDSNDLCIGELSRDQGLNLPINDVSKSFEMQTATGHDELVPLEHNMLPTLDANFQIENECAVQRKQELPTSSDAQGKDFPHVSSYPPVQWVEDVSTVEVGTSVNLTQDGLVQQTPALETFIDMQWPHGKRKSPFQEETSDHVDKFQLGSSPEGRPVPSPVRELSAFPYGVCWTQIKRGECRSGSTCKYQHLSASELNQFREVNKLTRDSRQDNAFVDQVLQVPQIPQVSQIPQVAQIPQVPPIQQPDHQSVPLQQDVMTVEENVKTPPVSFESVIQHLNNNNLGAAWQLIERLHRMNSTVGLPILERTLVLCSEHFEDPDTVAQVACKAFDMIGRVRVRHNRHDYITLIKTLCNSGQYIRAYEMLEVMKKSGFAPTYDMFLNLVQGSEKDPDWAFDLLDDIKSAGLFMSDICSDLILLGCRSGEHFVQKTWLLFQEALQNQVKLKPEAVSSMLLTLAQSNKWEESVIVTRAFPDAVPVEFIKASMLSGYRNIDWDEAILGLLSMIPAEKLAELDSGAWNTFLCSCCVEQSGDLSFPQRIYSVMQQRSVPLTAECANEFLSALCDAGQWSPALELFTNICLDTQVLEQAHALQKGLLSLTSALSRAGQGSGMLTVVHFMLEYHIKPSENVLKSSVENLDNEKNFLGVHQFFNQLQAANIVPPLAVYRQIVSSLEKWAENPSASTEAYTALRQAYPVLQQESSMQKAVSKESSKQEQDHPRKTVCRYFGSARGCFLGDKCMFLHPGRGVSVPEESSSISGGSISGESTAGSLNSRRPLQPFLLQNQDTQLREMLPTKQSGQPFNENWISQSAPETSPFVLQNMRGGTMPFSQAVKPELSQTLSYGGSEGYNAESTSAISYERKPHNQGHNVICKFYDTPQGCRHGSNCRFVHSQRDFSLPSSTTQVHVVNPPEGNTETASNNEANSFVFKDAFPTSSKVVAGGVQVAQHQPVRPTSQNILGMEPKIPVSSVFRRFPCPPTFREQHFQLAGVGNFQGRNPFSPILPERARSLDGLQSSTDVSASHQAHSAPVVSERPETSFFQYPSKKNSQFYLPKIKYSSQEKNWDNVADVYITMKHEDVEIDDVALQAFYEAFVSNCPRTIGGCFDKFVHQLHNFIDKNNEPDQSPGASFDDEDKSLIGQLGVAFMHFCHSGGNFIQGYTILHTLHNYSINYTLYNGAFGVHQRPLTATEVTLTAADLCLRLDQPLYNSALEVLRGTNYALPATGMSLDAEEAAWRSNVFQTLCRNFMKEKSFDLTGELLANTGDAEKFGGGELKALYNEYLVALVQSCQLNKAMELFNFMEKDLISRDPEAMRVLINGLGSAGLITQAKTYFRSGYFSAVYPIFTRESPWTVSIKTSYSSLECQFYIESHLQMLYEFLEEQLLATGHKGFIDSYCRALRVVISSDEVPRLYSGYMGNDGIICCVRDMVVTVLNKDFNPPLACDDLGKDEEIIVNALSLKRWFRANPTSGHFKGGNLSVERSVTSIDSRNANQHPYLQPGMSNIIVSSLGQESEGRRVSVFMNTDALSPRQQNSEGEQVLQPLSWKNVRGKVAHVICGRLTGYLRQGKIENKESFRQWARKLTQAYLKIEGISLQQNYEAGKERIYQFVDEYFKENQ